MVLNIFMCPFNIAKSEGRPIKKRFYFYAMLKYKKLTARGLIREYKKPTITNKRIGIGFYYDFIYI